jgi:vancomycin resistance protein YoaR
MNTDIQRKIKDSIRLLYQCSLLLLVFFLILGSLYAGCDPLDGMIAENVTVGGISVGDMSMEQAYRTLRSASESILEQTELIAEFPEETLSLSPVDTKATMRCGKAAWDAWKVGRFGNQDPSIALLPYLKLDEAYIRQVIADYARMYNTDVTPGRYALSGEMPDLEIESGAESTRTLELTMGLPSARLNQEDAFHRILAAYDSAFASSDQDAYSVSDFKVDILEEPDAPDLDAIYKDVYIAPVDDSIDLENHCVTPGAWGYHFDIESAAKLVQQADYGETVSIPMVFQEPDIFEDDVYFQDILGYCETKHTQDENRNNNLRRACESMNGVILQPGEVFSYNDTLGQRTKENGYLRAGAYSGWELVQSYGGGICQGSSTIYCAALYADMEIVHRRNHGYRVGYMQPGLDATVNWGGPDFQFRNSSHFPVKIAAEVSDGYVKVTILGTEDRDYYIEMETEVQWGGSGIYAKSYRCKYDKATGELISRELEARSNYAG